MTLLQKKRRLIDGKGYSCIEVTDLPVVQVSVWAGMSKENKKKVVEGMTRVFEELGIPREAVTIIIYEVHAYCHVWRYAVVRFS